MEAADYAAMPRAAEYAKSLSAAELQADAACSGYLRKRSEHVKSWNRRWFVLWPKKPLEGHGRLLIYYSKPTDEQARGVYRLHPGEYSLQTEQTKKHKVCLVLTTNKPNKWDEVIQRIVLSVDDVEKAVDWARAINSTGIALPKKEQKKMPVAQLGAGLGDIIEEMDDEEDEEEDDDEDGSGEDGESDGSVATSNADSEDSPFTPALGGAVVQEGIPPLLLSQLQPEPEPEPEQQPELAGATPKGSRSARIRSSKSASGLPLDGTAPRLSPSSLSPTAAAADAAEGGDKAFGVAETASTVSKATMWRKSSKRGNSTPELLEERRPSISITQGDYNHSWDGEGVHLSLMPAGTPRDTPGAGGLKPAVAVLGLKPWNANRATNAPMHLDLQIAKELKTLDWSPGVRKSPTVAAAGGGGGGFDPNKTPPASTGGGAAAVSPLALAASGGVVGAFSQDDGNAAAAAAGSTGGRMAFAGQPVATLDRDSTPAALAPGPAGGSPGGRSASAPKMMPAVSATKMTRGMPGKSPSTSPSPSPPTSPAKADGKPGEPAGGRTLAAALRSSIGAAPENKSLQASLLAAGGTGDVRSVLAVMAEYVNGMEIEKKLMESENDRLVFQLEASQATSSSLASQVKEGLDREAALEAEVARLKEQAARAALAPLSGSEEL